MRINGITFKKTNKKHDESLVTYKEHSSSVIINVSNAGMQNLDEFYCGNIYDDYISRMYSDEVKKFNYNRLIEGTNENEVFDAAFLFEENQECVLSEEVMNYQCPAVFSIIQSIEIPNRNSGISDRVDYSMLCIEYNYDGSGYVLFISKIRANTLKRKPFISFINGNQHHDFNSDFSGLSLEESICAVYSLEDNKLYTKNLGEFQDKLKMNEHMINSAKQNHNELNSGREKIAGFTIKFNDEVSVDSLNYYSKKRLSKIFSVNTNRVIEKDDFLKAIELLNHDFSNENSIPTANEGVIKIENTEQYVNLLNLYFRKISKEIIYDDYQGVVLRPTPKTDIIEEEEIDFQ